jgi:cation/acetate symporter
LKKPLTDEDLFERASIDGRVAFAVAAFALAAGLVALLDRVGVPERIVGILGPIFVLGGLAVVGLLLHSMRVSRFHAAGRAVPAPYAGLAFMALSTGLFLPFLPPVPGGASLTGLLTGFGLGYLLAALVTGPLLRKTGAFSLPDLLTARFPQLGLRLGAIAVVGAVAVLVTIAGYESAVRGLVNALAMPRGFACVLVAVILLLVVVPGGVSGVVWAATGAAGILLASLLLPLALLILRGEPLPLPGIGQRALWDDALAHMVAWHGATPAAFSSTGVLLIAAIAIGVAALGPLLSPAMTCNDASAARRAGLSSLTWWLSLIAIVAATMAYSALAVENTFVGSAADALPAYAYRAAARGLLTICGQAAPGPEAALAACKAAAGYAGSLRPQDIVVSGGWLVAGLSELRGFSVAFSGLVAAGLIAVGVMLAASGIQVLGTAVGHDMFYRVRDTTALTSRRLAATRLTMTLAIIVLCGVLMQVTIYPAAMIGMAIVFSAAAVAPLMALALWPRVSAPAASLALLAGLCTAGGIIALGGDLPSIERLAASALAGCFVALLVGVATSLRRSRDQSRTGRLFVEGVLHGEGEILNTDGAS